MAAESGNLFSGMPGTLAGEEIATLLSAPNIRIERIVSRGHSSPPGFWYDQDRSEWVVVLAGSAAVLFESETAPHTLRRGDWLHIPAHARHRVEWTDKDEPTIWIAVHYS
jgi:cupin 2 domain-containing protein